MVRTAASTYHLHQIIVRSRSESLGVLCKLEVADDGWLRGSVDLRREDPEAVDCMLQYLYKDDYRAPDPTKFVAIKDERSCTVRCETQPPLLHVKVYCLAEKYNLTGLRVSALEKFKASSRELWHTKGFLEAAREAYTTDGTFDKDLCNVVIGIFATRLRPLLQKGGASALLLDMPALALHLLKFPSPWS